MKPSPAKTEEGFGGVAGAESNILFSALSTLLSVPFLRAFGVFKLILEWSPKAGSPRCPRKEKVQTDAEKEMPARDPTVERQTL